jgi:hypothetical protein
MTVEQALALVRKEQWDGTTVDGREWVVAFVLSTSGTEPRVFVLPKSFFKLGCGFFTSLSLGWPDGLAENTSDELLAALYEDDSKYELPGDRECREGLGVNDFVARNPWYSMVFIDDGL